MTSLNHPEAGGHHLFQLPGIPFWKRLLDVSLIIAASPVLVPVMAFITLVIKLVSPGPVLFRQVRVGYRGSHFTCFKFRTMKVNADTNVHQGHVTELLDSDKPMKKLDACDPRVIPCGLVLRTLGLDELPQVFNVLRGEMSLVGPRPCLPYEYKNYTPRQKKRFEAVPGLTGLWQVSGKNRTTFKRMIDLDIEYARDKSFWLDLKIILKTVPALAIQTQDLKQETKESKEAKPVFQDASLERN